jgi:hypothetical protein
MTRCGWTRPGALAALVVAVATGCAEPTVPRRDRPAVVPGAGDPAFRVALLAPAPPDDGWALQRNIAPEKPAPGGEAALTPPAQPAAPAPAGDDGRPPGDALDKTEVKAEEDTGLDQGVEILERQTTKTRDPRPSGSEAGRRGRPSEDRESPFPSGARPADSPSLSLVVQPTASTEVTGEPPPPSEPGPLPPPPPPPAMLPGSIGAPLMPAPASLRSAEATTGSPERVLGGGTGLSESALQAALRRREGALQRCYDGLLLRAPGTDSGSLTVRLQIGTSGDVQQLDRVGGTLDDDAFERCVLDQLRGVVFPSGDTPTVYTHSFRFAPSGAAAPLTE